LFVTKSGSIIQSIQSYQLDQEEIMAPLTAEQLTQFEEEGYLVVRGLFDPIQDLDPVIAEYHGVLDNLAQDLYDQSVIGSTYDELPFGQRLTQIYAESGQVHAQYFDFSLPQNGVKEETPMWVGPAVFRTMTNKRLLDVVELLIGPEIYSNPVQHVRLKPPEHLTPRNLETGQVQLGATPWHQDNGVVLPEADETQMLTVWFSLWDATEENGCLQVVPRSHREGLFVHCPGQGGLHVPDQLFPREQAAPQPMKRGDVLFMHRSTLHASLSNCSDNIRWSFDLRYNPIGQATGRGAFPGFVARSQANPAAELRDPAAWADLWYETRRRLAADTKERSFNRWDGAHPVCA
jgi:ectoine hydroxylase-related dioxygenase (phytanoyl-CoA dioxygenase family)